MGKLGKLTALAAGAGAAAWFLSRNRQPAPTIPAQGGKQPRIVVAGAGFAGIAALQELSKQLPPGAADVTLIDHNNFHLFTPLLYQIGTGSVDANNLTYSLRRFCVDRGYSFICSTIERVNPEEKLVMTASGPVPYDYLVFALGSETNFFGMDDVRERTYGLKTVPDALELHRQVIRNFERASHLSDPDERRRLLTFITVGGGASGIELTGSLHDLVQHNLIRYYPEIGPDEARIILLEASDRVLPGINHRIGELALKRFDQLGIDVRLNTPVTGIRNGAAITHIGDQIPADVIIWTAGIVPNPVAAELAVDKTADNRIKVDEHLRIPAFPTIFALGDHAAPIDRATGDVLPPNAAVAQQAGRATGQNLARLMRGEPLLPFTYSFQGELIALGRLHAAAELGPFVFDGLPAWIVWRMVYLTMLMGTKNRAGLVVDWIASLFAQREIVDTDPAQS